MGLRKRNYPNALRKHFDFTSKSIGFRKALSNSLLLAFFSVFVQLPISLGFALLLGKGRKGERGFLSIYFVRS